MRRSLFLTFILISSWTACRPRTPPAPKEHITASALPRIVVRAKSKMLFTFVKDDGSFATENQLDKIPQERRGWVRVVDLTIQPSRRLDHELVYVADLRTAQKDGNYPYVVMSREAFEAAATRRSSKGAMDRQPPPSPAQGKTGTKTVILYATTWCPACRSARQYMTEKGIHFIEKDIEKDSAAAAELLQKARRAGISASGVPVLEVNGTLMQGFDPQRLTTLLDY